MKRLWNKLVKALGLYHVSKCYVIIYGRHNRHPWEGKSYINAVSEDAAIARFFMARRDEPTSNFYILRIYESNVC